MPQHKIVSQSEWTAERKALLAKEKEFTRARDELSAERRALPWVKVDKAYVFDTPQGKKTLAELFGEQEPAHRLPLHARPRLGSRAARAAPSSPTISTAPSSICRSATWPSSRSRARRSPRSRPTSGAWAGGSHGSRRSAATSTSISTSPSPRSELAKGRSTTTTTGTRSDSDELPGASVFYKDATARSFTPIRPTRADSTS